MPFAQWIPIIGGIANSILSGINNRKARLYNSPANQVARLNEAGLPLAANTHIGGGTAVTTPTTSLGTENFAGNLKSSIDTQVSRKQLQIMKDEARIKKAEADIAEGSRNNQLNPPGKFENTNQGTGAMQTIQAQEEAIKAAQIINKWMPIEKFQNIMKQGKEIEHIAQNIKQSIAQTKNIEEQFKGILSDNKIKSIVSNYQERMSLQELINITRKNTGINKDNVLKSIAIQVEYGTLLSRITISRNAALQSGQNLEAARLGNVLTNLSLPSTKAYYEIRRSMDNATMAKPNLPNTLLYLGMFQPNTSNYNMSNLGAPIHTGLSRWWDLTQ